MHLVIFTCIYILFNAVVGEGGEQRRGGDDGGYRRRPAGDDKKASGAPGGFRPEFRGGMGRGQPAAAKE